MYMGVEEASIKLLNDHPYCQCLYIWTNHITCMWHSVGGIYITHHTTNTLLSHETSKMATFSAIFKFKPMWQNSNIFAQSKFNEN